MTLDGGTDRTLRRHLTIFFSDLAGSTRIAAAMDPEDYAELLQRLRDLCEQIVPRHGGEIVRVDGDGVLCIFGYPVPYEDAGRRATEAAIDLHAAASALDQSFASPDARIRLHTGIHSGTVLVRPGDLVRGRFEMLGDATNVAARLCDLATADEIVASEATLGADRSFFTTGPQRMVRLEGRQYDLPVYTIFGREQAANRYAARIRRGVAPFAGRVTELTRLEQILADVRRGQPRIAVLAGPAGIGKTRLASEFLDRATMSGAVVHRGYCEAYLSAQPLQPFTQIFDSIRDRGPRPEIHTAVLESLAPALLTRVTQSHIDPLIFAIDDWQWADDASRTLFQALVSAATGPVLFLLSTRHDDPALAELATATTFAMQPLANSEAEATIEGMLATPEPFLVERIRNQAGGNPLYIEELCHALGRGSGATVQGDRNTWLDTLIQARFARLPPDQATLVSTAAVIGHILPIWLFEAITGVGADAPAVRHLMDKDFIYEGETADTLRFKHSLTRDAIYRTVGLKRRQALHRRAAEALEMRSALAGTPSMLDSLAYHFAACGDEAKAMDYSARAGDAAMAVPALDRAQAHYRKALTLLASLEPTAARVRLTSQIVHKFGLASVVDPSPEQLDVLEDAERLAVATHNEEGLTYARYWSGALLYGVGRSCEAIVKLKQALADAELLGRPRLVDQLQANLGQAYFIGCEYVEARTWLDTGITAMQARKPRGLATGLAYAIGCRALLHADQGRFEDAQGEFASVDELLGNARPAMLGSILNKRSVARIWQGDHVAAVRYAEAGIEHGTLTRSRYYTMMSRALLAYASWKIDPRNSQIIELAKATAWFESGASQYHLSLCHGWLADVLSRTGDVAGARRAARAALDRARKGDRIGKALAYRALARTAATADGPRSSRHYLQRAYRAATARGSARETTETQLCEAEIALSRGDVTGAATLAGQAKAGFVAMAMDYHATQAGALVAAAAAANR